jgi:hypothetical protein
LVTPHVALHRVSMRTLMSGFEAGSVPVGVREESRCCHSRSALKAKARLQSPEHGVVAAGKHGWSLRQLVRRRAYVCSHGPEVMHAMLPPSEAAVALEFALQFWLHSCNEMFFLRSLSCKTFFLKQTLDCPKRISGEMGGRLVLVGWRMVDDSEGKAIGSGDCHLTPIR